MSNRSAIRTDLLGSLLIACALATCAAAAAEGGAVYVVSPDGSDAAAGDTDHPLRTVAKALSLVKPGDTVRMLRGSYRDRITVRLSGVEGKPITIEGQRGPGGEWCTSLDPSVPLTAKWVPAPEVGEGVYKMPLPGFEPHLMLVDGKFIPRVWPDHMADGLGFKKMAYPPDQQVAPLAAIYPGPTPKRVISGGHGEAVDPKDARLVSYWDVMGAFYGCRDGTVYIRFRDRDDPNTKAIRVAPKGGGLEIAGQSWIVVRDLFVQGGQSCIVVKGPNARHNVIENCRLVNASERVTVNEASCTIVRNNEISAEFYSDKCRTGAWITSAQGNAVPYELALKSLFYDEYKRFFGPNTTSDYGIRLSGGSDNDISGNRVSKGGQGICITRTARTHVRHNTVAQMSSIGIVSPMDKVVDAQIHDNLVQDCNIACRIHDVNEAGQAAPRSLYVYRNRFWQRPHVGNGIWVHYLSKNDVEPYPHAKIFIYHNSFIGARFGIGLNAYVDQCGGMPNTLIANNVFANPEPIRASSQFLAMEGAWRFDYNWLGGSAQPILKGHPAVWYGPHNVAAKGQVIWDGSTTPDCLLPADSTARHAGIDLSTPFEIAGRKYEILPGMTPGYFKGPRPDMGAHQSQ